MKIVSKLLLTKVLILGLTLNEPARAISFVSLSIQVLNEVLEKCLQAAEGDAEKRACYYDIIGKLPNEEPME